MRMRSRVVATIGAGIFAAIACCGAISPASAGSSWDDIRAIMFAGRAVEDGQGIVSFVAPYRSEDDRRVPVSATASFADGRTVKSVSFVIDENPMPLAAAFRFGQGATPAPAKVGLGLDIRLNGPSVVRAVVEASDGRLYMAESLVKTSGQGACAAPPVADSVAALATLGNMELAHKASPADAAFTRHARLKVRHPQLTGMQMNQITLLYIPARYVSELEVRQGAETVFTAETGFALSEDPRIDFDYRLNGAEAITVRVKDTDGATFQRSFPRGVGG